MTKILASKRYFDHAPREAISDLVGLGAMCLIVVAGFCAPAFF